MKTSQTISMLASLALAFSAGCGSSNDTQPANGVGGSGGQGSAQGTGGAGTTATNAASVTSAASGGGTTTSSSTGNPAGTGGGTPGSGAFPASSVIYQDISNAPLDPASSAMTSSFTWTKIGVDFSFVIMQADPSLTPRAFTGTLYSPDCDTAPVPVPPGGAIEGSANNNYECDGGPGGGDCHLLVYQGTRLYELYQANITGGDAVGGTFTGGCLALWDLTRDYWSASANPYSRGEGCTGADAADLPLTALMITKQDLVAGAITHALRFTIPNKDIRSGVYVHPSTHLAGGSGGANTPPYGARFRLKKSFDLSTLPNAAARTIGKALQTYGMIMSDGGNPYISATIDSSDEVASSDISSLKVTDFEVLDLGTTMSGDDCNRTVITK